MNHSTENTNPLHDFGRLSFLSIVATALLTMVHHFYKLGPAALGLGFVLTVLPTISILWFRKTRSGVALTLYGLVNAWIIIGFGIIDGFWDSTIKLFISNGLFPDSRLFIREPVGNFFFEITGVLTFVASVFAMYYGYKFAQAAIKAKEELRFKIHHLNLIMTVIALVLLGIGSYRSYEKTITIPKDGIIKIGVIVPSTGPTALLGSSFIKAVQVAQDDINKNSSQYKYKYELVIENSSISDTRQTETAIRKLIDVDKVSAIVGGISMSGEIVKPYVTAAKIPHICVCSITSIGDGNYNFTDISVPTADAKAWVEEAQKRGIRTIAILTSAYPSIDGHTTALKAEAERKGMKVVYENRFALGTTDFTEMIKEAKATSPDIYFAETLDPPIDVIGQQLRDAGIRNISAFVAPALSTKPELFEGVWYVDTDASKAFQDRFEEMYPNTQFAAHMMPFAYDAFMLFVKGFESGEDVTKYIQDIREYDSAAGKVNKKEGSGTFEPTPAIWVIKNGKPELLYGK